MHTRPLLRLISWFFSLLWLVAATSALSDDAVQAPAETQRPRIGIALGGGGARGAAHVGVLQVLHEMRIPIDYVSGTSMGAIVGSLFSVGVRPDDIGHKIVELDWDDLFSDRPERQLRNYRRKEDDSVFFLPIEFGIKDKGLVLTRGVIAGQKLSFAFRNPQLYVAGRDGFDNLTYPFRPVATDLRTGKMVVMDRGNLLQAVRASMSIPGVFPPVEWHGHHLVDGYLARNLPVDVVRNMGADIVIAVDVGALPEDTPQEDLETILGISAQTGVIQARQNVLVQLPNADVVIHVDLQDITAKDFKRVGEAIPLGRQAALSVAESLAHLALSPEAYAEHMAKHQAETVPQIIIDEIRVTNNADVDDQAIYEHIHQQVGHPLDLDLLYTDLNAVYDFGVFELVDFHVLQEDGHTTLEILANSKYYAPNILNFGLSYSGGQSGISVLNARLRLNRLEMNRYGSEWRTDLQLGKTTGLITEFYQPLTWKRRPFVAARLEWSHALHNWYYDTIKWGEYMVRRYSAGLDLGLRLGHIGELRGGMEYGHLRAQNKTGISLTEFDGVRGGYRVKLGIDMLDAAVFARSGYALHSRLFLGRPEFGSDLDYDRLEASARGVFSLAKHSITFVGRGGSSLGTDLPEFDRFTLGGLGRLGGYLDDQLRGDAYAMATTGWTYMFSGSASPYSTSWYIGLSIEAGNTWPSAADARLDDLRYCSTFSIMANTLVGPVSLAYGRANDGNDAVYLTVGRLAEFMD